MCFFSGQPVIEFFFFISEEHLHTIALSLATAQRGWSSVWSFRFFFHDVLTCGEKTNGISAAKVSSGGPSGCTGSPKDTHQTPDDQALLCLWWVIHGLDRATIASSVLTLLAFCGCFVVLLSEKPLFLEISSVKMRRRVFVSRASFLPVICLHLCIVSPSSFEFLYWAIWPACPWNALSLSLFRRLFAEKELLRKQLTIPRKEGAPSAPKTSQSCCVIVSYLPVYSLPGAPSFPFSLANIPIINYRYRKL